MNAKRCVDCKYHCIIEYGRSSIPLVHICNNPNTKIPDLVTGIDQLCLCVVARALSCGPEGKFYIEKENK